MLMGSNRNPLPQASCSCEPCPHPVMAAKDASVWSLFKVEEYDVFVKAGDPQS